MERLQQEVAYPHYVDTSDQDFDQDFELAGSSSGDDVRLDLTSWPEVAPRSAGGVRRIPGAIHGAASRVSQQLESFRQPRVTRFSSREMQCASHGRARRGPVLFFWVELAD